MNEAQVYTYARDSFHYPRFMQRLGDWLFRRLVPFFAKEKNFRDLESLIWTAGLLGGVIVLFGRYFFGGLFIGLWVFFLQVKFRIQSQPSDSPSRLQLFFGEGLISLALVLHLWFQGHLFTGLAGLVGILGLYLLTVLENKYDLSALHLPKLYFLRTDRMGFVALGIFLGAFGHRRAYLWPILTAWFLAVLTFYDYLWLLIQLMKHKPSR